MITNLIIDLEKRMNDSRSQREKKNLRRIIANQNKVKNTIKERLRESKRQEELSEIQKFDEVNENN